MAQNNVYVTDIILNSQQAQNEIKKVKSQADDLRKKLKDATAAHDVQAAKKYGKELDKIERKYQGMITKQERIAATLKDISQATPKDLQDTIKAINRELNSGKIKRGSEEWKLLNKQLREARTELAAIRNEGKAQTPFWGRLADGFNKFGAMAATAVASITGLSMTIRKVVQDFAAMDQAMANVRKYTGQTAEEVERMNEDFKRMDTRTSREELNELAGAAGRLGITATSQIEEFVDAADKIGVALGDDLGQGAVDTIGKLAIAFGESDRLGLRGAMLATGSALNEIVQNSSAQAQPVVEFTKALSGVGQQAHLTQAEIMGFASALDQNNQEMATSSTVMSQLITKMYQDPARFANMAGLEVEKFTKTIKENMNQGLIEWFQAVNKLGDMSVLAGKFDELKMDGTRAVGVLSTLAGHIDQVTEAQQLANAAYEQGTSVIEEFNVQNNTIEASIDKAKKRFKDLSIELGQKLLPVARYAISTASLSVKALKDLVDFVGKYKATLMTLIVTIGLLVLKKEADVLITKAEVLWNEKLVSAWNASVAACKRLWAAIAANPYTAAAAAGMVLLGVLTDLLRRTKDITKAESDLTKIRTTAKTKVEEQRLKVELLVKASNDENLSLSDKLKAIGELNRIIPGYINNLDEKTGKYTENKKALDNYIKSLEKMYELEGAKEVLADIGKQIAETRVQIEEQKEAAKGAGQLQQRVGGMGYNPAESAFMSANIASAEGKVEESNRKLKKLLDRRKLILNQYQSDLLAETTDSSSTGGGGGGGGGGSSDDKNKGSHKDPYQEDLKKLEDAYKHRQYLIKKQLADGLIIERDYQEQSYNAEMDFLAAKMALQEKYGKGTGETELQILDKTMQQAKIARERSAKEMQEELKAADDAYQADRLSLAEQRQSGEIASEKAFQNRIKELETDYLSQRLAIIQKFGGDTLQAEKAVIDKQLANAKDFQDSMRAAFEKAYDNADTLQDQRMYAQMMYEDGLIDFENYQHRMTEIEMMEQEARAQIRQQFYNQAMELLSSASAYAQACSDLEVAKITANYDRQIEAAGKNSKKRERLEKERDEKIRKQKTASNERAMKIEIAQAIANTATNALGAFGAVLQPQMPWTVPLAYAAAAAATLNGMLQIATIKKQHQAEAAGYYEGGFTGGNRYRREAGVVHEGEFVASHEAVNNGDILPALQLIDRAQRANTVGQLRADDIARSVSPASTPAPVVNIIGNPDATEAINDLNSVVATLNAILAAGIRMDTEQASNELRRFERLRSNT